MDLEIVGRCALLFDDDATAEVVNSGGSVVPWAAIGAADLLLDRHDIRRLLDRVPPRPRRAYSVALLSTPSPDGVSERLRPSPIASAIWTSRLATVNTRVLEMQPPQV